MVGQKIQAERDSEADRAEKAKIQQDIDDDTQKAVRTREQDFDEKMGAKLNRLVYEADGTGTATWEDITGWHTHQGDLNRNHAVPPGQFVESYPTDFITDKIPGATFQQAGDFVAGAITNAVPEGIEKVVGGVRSLVGLDKPEKLVHEDVDGQPDGPSGGIPGSQPQSRNSSPSGL